MGDWPPPLDGQEPDGHARIRWTPSFIHWRYLNTLAYPIAMTIRPFLERGITDAVQVLRMGWVWQARLKAALSRVTLWSQILSA